MKLGSHRPLVEEILAAVAHEAKRYAWSRPIAGDESSTWNDLREDEVAPFHAVPFEHPELKPAYDETQALLEPLLMLLREKLPAEYAELHDDVAADLQHCALNRALHGFVPDSFWECVWRVYRQGGWPCGWQGEYPQGCIVIFEVGG